MKTEAEVQLNIRLRGTQVAPPVAEEEEEAGRQKTLNTGHLRVTDEIITGALRLTTQGGRSAFLSSSQLSTVVTLNRVLTMRRVRVCFCLVLLLPWCVQAQRSRPSLAKLDEDTQRDMLAVDILNRSGVLNSLLRSEHHAVVRRARAPRPASQVPKRAQQGSRFALSLDVPTSILSVLIDLAKNQDMRTKAAANAELMARIGKRK